MRTADSSDRRRVARRCKPVMNGGADLAALDRRLPGPMMAGNHQQDSIAACNRLFETAIDRRPRGIEVHPVQIEHAVGLDPSAAELPVPAAVERLVGDRHGLGPRRRSRWRRSRRRRGACFSRRFSPFLTDSFPRQRADGGRDARPQLGFVRAERAHGRLRPSESGSALRRSPTCRRRSPPPPDPTPRRYRSGWRP